MNLDHSWGLHWPGGPLLTSLITPFLPQGQAVLVTIFISYWMLGCLAAGALTLRITNSRWLGFAGFLLTAGDHYCFNIAWYERYEMLACAISISAILALTRMEQGHRGARAAVLGAGFFLMPLIQPIFMLLGMAWVAYLLVRAWALKGRWTAFWIAACSYAAGGVAFIIYFFGRPYLYAELRNHMAQVRIEDSRHPDHGLIKFWHHVTGAGGPTEAPTAVYLIGMVGVFWLVWDFWRSRRDWREFLARNDVAIFAAIGVAVTLGMTQSTYHGTYFGAVMPFTAAVACSVFQQIMEASPRWRRVMVGVLAALVLLQLTFFPARIYLWSRIGLVNMRSQLGGFVATLPKQGEQIFIPEVLWDSYPNEPANVRLNSLPWTTGPALEATYAAYLRPQVKKGDVLVVDKMQFQPPVIDPTQPGWKVIGRSKLIYGGVAGTHGWDLTAYQKE